MATIKKALIVGAGIGGLTAAVAFRQQDIAVDIVEIKPDMSVYGVGIIQPNNTLRALDKIGLAQACVDVGAGFPGWQIFDAAGNHLFDAASENTAAPSFPPANGITRPRLHKILTDAAERHGVSIKLGITVDQLEDDGTGVNVTFTSGEQGRYDLVIGCDGTYSAMRKQLFGDTYKPTFTGQGVWRYNLPRPKDLEWGALYFGPDSKVGLVPMTKDLMYMLLVTYEPDNPVYEGDGMAREMRDRLAPYSGPVAELCEMITDPAGVVYRPMEPVLLPAPWMKGNIILIGDAAHSTTPHLAQGAAMAIEDAVLLGELMGQDTPVSELLSEFMERRFKRAEFVVNSSVQIGEWEMEEWKGIKNPKARPGELLHEASLALLEDY